MRLAYRRLILAGIASAFGSGCISREPAPTPRYFSPPAPAFAAKGDPAGSPIPIRFGRVSAAPHLTDRMVHRTSDVEVSFDDVNHWAATPDEMVKDAMYRMLSPENGFLCTGTSGGPVLSVQVTAFESLTQSRKVVVELQASLEPNGTAAIHRRTVRAERAADVDDPAAVARATGEALGDATSQIARWIKETAGGG